MPTDSKTPSHPRMAAIYAPGTVRGRRWHGEGDMRGYRPPSGWTSRRPHGHSPDHGSRLGASRVVDHRDEGVAAISTGPRALCPRAGGLKKSGRGGGRARSIAKLPRCS